jgi:short-subunit dehydrogenase
VRKKILLVGATSGIGKELAVAYANAGNVVGITGRRVELLRRLHELFPNNMHYAKHDISSSGNKAIFDDIVRRMDGLDILIISSGIGFDNADLDWELERRTIAVNVAGFSEIINLGYSFFRRQSYGHIVGISSIAAIRGIDSCPAYSASKAYISNYLEAIRKKTKRHKLNISVTEILPGFVDTKMAQGEGLFWVSPVEKAAKQIVRAVQDKRRIAYITKRWKSIAVLLKLLPNALYDRV